MTDDKPKPTQANLRDAIEAAIVAKSIEIIRGETLPAMGSVLTQYADAAFEAVRATDTQVSKHSELADMAIDSGMDGESIAGAEAFWAGLPAGRKWSGLKTYEKALVCHQMDRLEAALHQAPDAPSQQYSSDRQWHYPANAAPDAQVSSLVSALEQIADPIGFMQQRAKDEGCQIDGQMAVLISKDVEFLKSIARAALDGVGSKSDST